MTAKEHSDVFRSSFLSRLFPRRKDTLGSVESIEFPNIPRLEIVRKLGDGGMASVFLAKQVSTGREVAVKIMANHLQTNQVWADRFLDEARRLAQLSHPNIVPVFDWGNHEGIGYIVMEFIRGGDLIHRLDKEPVSVKDVIEITRQLASGLDFASEKGFVHRDIKPDNILFREDGSPCILDFGIAKDSTSNTTISSQGLAIGTGAYMSPEQAQPQGRAIDGRSDLYSLGVVLYQMLLGTRPFEYRQHEPMQAFQLYLFAHVNTPAPKLPGEFAKFQPILDRLLAKDPADRFGRGNDLRQALAKLESQLSGPELEYCVRQGRETTVAMDAQSSPEKAATRTELKIGDDNKKAVEPTKFGTLAGKLVSKVSEEKAPITASVARLPATSGWLVGVATVAMLVMVTGSGYWAWSEGRARLDGALETALSWLDQVQGGSESVESGDVSAPEPLPRLDSAEAREANRVQQLLNKAENIGTIEAGNIKQVQQITQLYREIVELAPGNAVATSGLAKLVQGQKSWVEEAISGHRFDELETRFEWLGSVAPEVAESLRVQLVSEQKLIEQQRLQQRQLAEWEAEIKQLVGTAQDGSEASRETLKIAAKILSSAQQEGLSAARYSALEEKISGAYLKQTDLVLGRKKLDAAEAWVADANHFVGGGVAAQLEIKLGRLQAEIKQAQLEAKRQRELAHQRELAQQKALALKQEQLRREQEQAKQQAAQQQAKPEEQLSQLESEQEAALDATAEAAVREPEQKPAKSEKSRFRTFGSF